MSDFWIANLIGVATLPIAIWQFGFSRSKRHFLVINTASCVLWYISLSITHQYTAAWVSLTAGMASLIQAALNQQDRHAHILWAWVTALMAMNIAVAVAPPTNGWSMLPVIAFIWVRAAEVFREMTMRVLMVISPVAWTLIAWHGLNYGLIPADLLAIASMFWWFFQHAHQSQKKSVVV